jgi:hypothetical protein
MKPGDLLKRTKTSRAGIRSSRSVVVGILLEEPRLPLWGNFPKNYRVLTPMGTVEVVSDEHRSVLEVVE